MRLFLNLRIVGMLAQQAAGSAFIHTQQQEKGAHNALVC
jgi:hypothetical protein